MAKKIILNLPEWCGKGRQERQQRYSETNRDEDSDKDKAAEGAFDAVVPETVEVPSEALS